MGGVLQNHGFKVSTPLHGRALWMGWLQWDPAQILKPLSDSTILKGQSKRTTKPEGKASCKGLRPAQRKGVVDGSALGLL